MALVHGNKGSVTAGGENVGKVQSFNLSIEAPVSDATAMGEEWETHLAGAPKRWSGSINAKRVTDDAGQEELSAGASVMLHLYDNGEISGENYYSGTATITSISHAQGRTDTVDLTFEFTGNGELAQEEVP
ncbi:hypothetical protein PsAD2_00405 [Pseudovibrio axinellae]|uniref:Phage major tail protein 2 n=1 Tax=Pseudovibrio axinellae TaxID=989403 RepID=A0A166AHL4_9HYPH|nr:hypothetical protein [Pseudovibrio axinellae]KZL21121.1 hypothetical protein PsAD2_00405 [Pseudovibrio axinellae]SEQ88359.1 hypothetical protein SAMN05421798_1059 [Pseudovibrio axinellae]